MKSTVSHICVWTVFGGHTAEATDQERTHLEDNLQNGLRIESCRSESQQAIPHSAYILRAFNFANLEPFVQFLVAQNLKCQFLLKLYHLLRHQCVASSKFEVSKFLLK